MLLHRASYTQAVDYAMWGLLQRTLLAYGALCKSCLSSDFRQPLSAALDAMHPCTLQEEGTIPLLLSSVHGSMPNARVLMQVDQLDLGYQQGNDRLLLRFPLVITHVIDHHSPLRAWQSGPSALAADADSEIVVVVSSPPPCWQSGAQIGPRNPNFRCQRHLPGRSQQLCEAGCRSSCSRNHI